MTDTTESLAKAALVSNRRNVLRGAVVLAAAIPGSASAERLVQPTDHQIGPRYKDSAHVQRFYALNRR